MRLSGFGLFLSGFDLFCRRGFGLGLGWVWVWAGLGGIDHVLEGLEVGMSGFSLGLGLGWG